MPLKIRERIGIAVAVRSVAQPGPNETATREALVDAVKTVVRNASVPDAIKCYHPGHPIIHWGDGGRFQES